MSKTYFSKVNLQCSGRICRHLQVIGTNSFVPVILMFIQFNPATSQNATSQNATSHETSMVRLYLTMHRTNRLIGYWDNVLWLD